MPTPFLITIRDAALSDASRIRDIYAPHILDGGITFETEVPSVSEFEERIKHYRPYGFLVAEVGGEVVAYAYGSRHRERQAYRWCCEVSVYADPRFHGHGIAKKLYRELLDRLKKKNLVNAYAGITLPNAASVALHESMGFRHIGTYRNIGFKSGVWHDVGWWELTLNSPQNSPPEPELSSNS